MNARSPDLGDFSPLLDEQLAAGKRGEFDRGAAIARELQAQFPNSDRAAFNRAWYEMREGNLLAGLQCLDRGRWVGAFGLPPLETSKPLYRNENLVGKHLLLRSEGGLGDEIINIRFAKNFAARGAKVAVSCAPPLMSVFARVEGVSSVVAGEAARFMHHDYWVPAMSAARVLELEFKDLNGSPYLSTQPESFETWRERLAPKFGASDLKIGLKFFGNPKFEHEQLRRFPEQRLIAALGSRPWVNLQLETTDLPIRSWEDTLGVLANLDLVITSCTSVAHASAALGVETWILVPILPYYIWSLPGERSPWYDSVRLFRQTNPGEWDSAFTAIANALDEKAKL